MVGYPSLCIWANYADENEFKNMTTKELVNYIDWKEGNPSSYLPENKYDKKGLEERAFNCRFRQTSQVGV